MAFIDHIRSIFRFFLEIFKMRLFNGRCTSSARLDGKTVVITGCNSGIGKEAVKDFYRRGARVMMACRNKSKVDEAMMDIVESCKGRKKLGELIFVELDLTSLESVRECAQNILKNEKRIDILVNNAGVMCTPNEKTKDGFEMQFGVNHLGHFLFTLLLLPKMAKCVPARIVNVASLAHAFGGEDLDDLNFEKRPYNPGHAYQQSKLCNILFASELARKLKASGITGITTYSLHPGVVATELGRHLDSTYVPGAKLLWSLAGYLLKTHEQGAQTTIYCAIEEEIEHESGLYYADCALTEPVEAGRSKENAKKLWEYSLKYCGMENMDPLTEIKTK